MYRHLFLKSPSASSHDAGCGAKAATDTRVQLAQRLSAKTVALATDEDRVYVTLLLSSRLRSDEARALRVSDLHLDRPVPSIQVEQAIMHSPDGKHGVGAPKTRGSRRTLTLDPQTVGMPRKHVAGKALQKRVFDLGDGGTWQRNRWFPACRAAGFEKNPRIHDLRGTHASWLLGQGLSIFDVSRRLGHSTIVTTASKYGQLDVSAGAAAAAAIGSTWARK